MKKVILNKNRTKFINPQGYFYHSTDGRLSQNKTLISLCCNDSFLNINFWGNNDFYLKNNIYKNIHGKQNQPLYNQEVFEIFIANGKETPSQYLELNINPNNALYASKIINEDKEASNNQNILIPFSKSKKIGHSVKKNFIQNTWQAKLSIPLSLIDEATEKKNNQKNQFYRLNFFRICNIKMNQNKQWQCNSANSEFTCWNSTVSKIQPKFHRSEFMGLLQII